MGLKELLMSLTAAKYFPLKSDQDGIESFHHHRKNKEGKTLKSDQDGIESKILVLKI